MKSAFFCLVALAATCLATLDLDSSNLQYHEITNPVSIQTADGLGLRKYSFKFHSHDFVIEIKPAIAGDDFFSEEYKEKLMSDYNAGVSFALESVDCVYEGRVVGDDAKPAKVAINLCSGGLEGHMFLADGKIVVIRPLTAVFRPKGGLQQQSAHSVLAKGTITLEPHILYYLHDQVTEQEPTQHACGAKHPEHSANDHAHTDHAQPVGHDKLQAATSKNLLVAIANDHARYMSLGQRTEADSVNIFNLARAYWALLGVNLVLVGQATFKEADPYTYTLGTDGVEADGISGLLDTFINRYALRVSEPQRYVTMLFSGLRFKNNVLGVSYIGTICNPTYAGLVGSMRMDTYTNAVIAAHELGHMFGCLHDGMGNSCPSTGYIMNAYASQANSWSSCSISESSKNMNAWCMNASPMRTAAITAPVEEDARPKQAVDYQDPTVSVIVVTDMPEVIDSATAEGATALDPTIDWDTMLPPQIEEVVDEVIVIIGETPSEAEPTDPRSGNKDWTQQPWFYAVVSFAAVVLTLVVWRVMKRCRKSSSKPTKLTVPVSPSYTVEHHESSGSEKPLTPGTIAPPVSPTSLASVDTPTAEQDKSFPLTEMAKTESPSDTAGKPVETAAVPATAGEK